MQISTGKKSVALQHLLQYIKGFQKLLAARGLSFGFPLSNESLEKNVVYLLTKVHINLVTLAPVDQRVWFNVDVQGENEVISYMQFQHYSNQLVYLMVPFCLSSLITSSSVTRNKEMTDVSNAFEDLAISPTQQDIQEYTYMRQLFSEEFVCLRGVELMEIMFASETWNTLVLHKDSNSNFNIVPSVLKRYLKRALAPFIISYWGVASTLIQLDLSSSPFEVKTFGKTCQATLRQKLGTRIGKYYGALSLDCVNNAVMSLINSGGLAKAKMYGAVVSFLNLTSNVLSGVFSKMFCYIPDPTAVHLVLQFKTSIKFPACSPGWVSTLLMT